MSFGAKICLLEFFACLCLVVSAQIACQRAPQAGLNDSASIVEGETSDANEFAINSASNDFQLGETSRRVNLNAASREELMRLPGIGAGLAARIIEHRTRFGRFRRPEHLLMVQGIGAHRFNTLQQFIEAK